MAIAIWNKVPAVRNVGKIRYNDAPKPQRGDM